MFHIHKICCHHHDLGLTRNTEFLQMLHEDLQGECQGHRQGNCKGDVVDSYLETDIISQDWRSISHPPGLVVMCLKEY